MPCCASAPKESRPICIEQLDSSRLRSCCCNYYPCLLGLYRENGKENGTYYIMITSSVYRQLRWIPRSSSCRQLRLSYTGHSSIYEPTVVQPIRIVSREKILWAALMEYILHPGINVWLSWPLGLPLSFLPKPLAIPNTCSSHHSRAVLCSHFQ